MSPTPPAVPPKKKGPLFWILIGVGGLMLLGLIAVVTVGFVVTRFVSGIADSDNPGFAAAKLAISLNPEVEILSEDADSGSITVRNKKTGEVTTMAIDPETKAFKVESDSGKGSVEIRDGRAVVTTDEGTTVIGANVGGSMPSWLPVYPGTEPTGSMLAETPTGKNSTYSFKTSDSTEKVLNFYKGELQSAGFQISTTIMQATGGMIAAQDGSNKRQVVVTSSGSGDFVLSVTERP